MADPSQDIECREVQRRLEAGDDLLLVDIRESDEVAVACLSDALLLPMSQLESRVGELEAHREREIVVFCHLGGRSARVVAWLRERGFTQVQNMLGGIDQWAEEIDPTIPKY